jgi:hypothetical protein
LEIKILKILKIFLTYVECGYPRSNSNLRLNIREEVEEEESSYWMTIRKQEDIGNWNKKAPDLTLWGARFERGYGSSQRQNT